MAQVQGQLREKKTKATAGSVVVRSKKNRLVLNFTWLQSLGGDGKRWEIPTGSDDISANFSIAEEQAKIIQRDIRNYNFDPTLAKYRGEKATRLTVVSLFERFIAWKKPQVYKATLNKYHGLLTTIKEQLGFATLAADIDGDRAMAFRKAVEKRFEPVTVRDKLNLMAAAWDWAIDDAKILKGDNPWQRISKSHKVPPKKPPKTFTHKEVKEIVKGFRNHPEYSYYSDFVEFFLVAGCRTGEVAGLCWRHLPDDCSAVWIGESVTVDGDRKSTKGNRARGFPLGKSLQRMLLRRRGDKVDPDASVFPSRKGKLINARNFARRPWKKVLKGLGIDYQRPYKLRGSNATISINEFGQRPLDVARRLGHNPKTMFDNYVGGEGNAPPDILDENYLD